MKNSRYRTEHTQVRLAMRPRDQSSSANNKNKNYSKFLFFIGVLQFKKLHRMVFSDKILPLSIRVISESGKCSFCVNITLSPQSTSLMYRCVWQPECVQTSNEQGGGGSDNTMTTLEK